jgi:two-component system, NarL family, nitrate/nitrite response regulator NarL
VPIRLVLVDDHPIVLSGLTQLFNRQKDMKVVGSATTADGAVEAVKTYTPDVLVLDLRMPGKSGLDALKALAPAGGPTRVVLLTAAIRDEEVVDAVQRGAKGIVLKESPPDALLECVRRVHAGEQWIDHETLTRAFDRVVHPEAAVGDAPLTPRELEIVRMVAEGLRNRAIADRLSITEGTVKVHLHNIYEKLGVDGRLELVLCAQENRLV